MIKRALLVVAKRPAPGKTKTRLTPPFSGEQAAALYECFLRDTLDTVRAARALCEFDPIICYAPEGAESYFRELAPDFKLLLQRGADLSERLQHATAHCLTDGGYQQVVIMDSDSPTLPVDCLRAAFEELATADVTLGACDDGGYYLIGLKAPAPRLFLEVTMSTPQVVVDTLALAAAENLVVANLREWYDIDYVADVRQLVAELETASATVARHTRAFLTSTANIQDLF